MAWPEGIVDDIRRRVGLVDLVARRVKLEKRGREYTGLCPFHSEKTPSFTVNESKGFYHCFGCSAHGDAFDFVMRTQGIDFPEAVKILAREAGVTLPSGSDFNPQDKQKRAGLYDVLAAARAWFQTQLNDAGGARDYLNRRGLTAQTIESFRIGWAPQGRHVLRDALRNQGFSEELMIEAGLLIKPEGGGAAYDRFRNRVMFAIGDAQGKTVAFGGRTLGAEKAKYINSPETPLFQKGRLLYAWSQSRPHMYQVKQGLVVEGYMDVLALHQAGLTTAVAPLGTALSEDQIRLLWKVVDEPVLCFDGDAAGVRAATRAAERALPLLKPGQSLRFAMLPSGSDPDSLVASQGVEAMKECISGAVPMVDWVWRGLVADMRLETPEQWAALKHRLQKRAGYITDSTVREEYRRALMDRFWRLRRSSGSQGNRQRVPRGDSVRPHRRDPHLEVKILLALILSHPWLAAEMSEELGFLDIPDLDLDHLRQAMIECSDFGQLDKEDLIRQLIEKGHGAAVKDVDAVGIQFCLKRADDTRQNVRQLWQEHMRFLRQAPLRAELRAAGAVWASHSDDHAADRRFWALKRRIQGEEKKLFNPRDRDDQER